MTDHQPDSARSPEAPPAPAGLRPEEVALLIEEAGETLTGLRVDKIFDRGPNAIVLRLRGREGRFSLLFSTTPGFTRFHFVEPDGSAPPKPTETVRELRELLKNGVVTAVDQPGGDRLVRLRMRVKRGERTHERFFVLELFGRRGRLIVCDATSRNVLFLLGRGGIAVGERYRFPDAPPRSDRILFPFDPRASIADEDREDAHPFHRALARRMADAEERAEILERTDNLLRWARKERSRRGQLEKSLARDLDQAQRWEEPQRQGELLKAMLGTLKRGMKSVTVTDYFDPELPEVEVVLDPRKDGAENVEALFRKARKRKRGAAVVEARLAACRRDIAKLDAALEELEATPSLERLSAVSVEFASLEIGTRRRGGGAGGKKSKKGPDTPTGPRRYRSREGLEIVAGRSARENEFVTRTLAKGNDIFFHRANKPGAHVILRVPKGRNASPESIEDAAFLAAYLSGWRGPETEIVHWTAIKYVRKPRGAPLGTVTISQEREFVVSYRPELLARLVIDTGAGGG